MDRKNTEFTTAYSAVSFEQSRTMTLLNFRSIIAGLLVTFLAYFVLSSLGAGLGGAAASSALRDGQSADVAAGGTAIFMVISVLIALAVGCYFASRTSTAVSSRLGGAHAVVISALFFTFLVWGTGKTIGAAGKGLGMVVGAASMGAADLASSPAVQSTVDNAIGDTQLKSEPGVVAQGLATRLLRGDNVGARNYLAYQTGLPAAEVDARLANLETQFNEALRQAGDQTARAVSLAGWTFLILMLGGISSAVGGSILAVHMNARKPLAVDESSTGFVSRPALV